ARAPACLGAPRLAYSGPAGSACTSTGCAGSTWVAGLVAVVPETVTRPAAMRSAACWRDRAIPRRTSSASRRIRRATRLSPPPLGGLAQASLQQLVQVLERRDVLGQRGSFEVLGSRERSLELVGALGLPGVGAGLDVHVAHAIAPTSSGRVRTLMSTPASARAVGRSASSLAAHAAAHAARSSSRSSTTSPCSGRSSPPEPST